MIAALFVATDGCYFCLPDVDPWDETRDARLYAGPHPVIAHPPCERWGRYWGGGPSARVRLILGDDKGCFASARESVGKYGGVLEHPEASHAFAHYGLNRPPWKGGWVPAGDGGFVCCVAQGHYGHPARKMTWLYTRGTDLPDLIWGPTEPRPRLDQGYHSKEERMRLSPLVGRDREATRLSPAENLATPIRFRDEVLLPLARSVTRLP